MRKFLFFLLLLAVCVVALGIYMDWFKFTSNTTKDSGKVDVGLTIDKEKFKQDTAKGEEKVKAATEKATEKVNDAKTTPSK